MEPRTEPALPPNITIPDNPDTEGNSDLGWLPQLESVFKQMSNMNQDFTAYRLNGFSNPPHSLSSEHGQETEREHASSGSIMTNVGESATSDATTMANIGSHHDSPIPMSFLLPSGGIPTDPTMQEVDAAAVATVSHAATHGLPAGSNATPTAQEIAKLDEELFSDFNAEQFGNYVATNSTDSVANGPSQQAISGPSDQVVANSLGSSYEPAPHSKVDMMSGFDLSAGVTPSEPRTPRDRSNQPVNYQVDSFQQQSHQLPPSSPPPPPPPPPPQQQQQQQQQPQLIPMATDVQPPQPVGSDIRSTSLSAPASSTEPMPPMPNPFTPLQPMGGFYEIPRKRRKKAHRSRAYSYGSSRKSNPVRYNFIGDLPDKSLTPYHTLPFYRQYNGLTFDNFANCNSVGSSIHYEQNKKFRANMYEPAVNKKYILEPGHPAKSSNQGNFALCPYCQLSTENRRNNCEKMFYKRNDSNYLHHMIQYHGIFSNGELVKDPEVRGWALTPEEKTPVEVVQCPYCDEFVSLKKFKPNNEHEHRLLKYLRHVKEKHKTGKNLEIIQRQHTRR